MEIKQLEYFLAVCNRGSINKAADCLYTTQPNVSKVINALEHELGRKLFNRTNKGISLTPYGKTIRQYAEVILKHTQLISDLATPNSQERFSIAAFRSDIISKILVRFFNTYKDEVLLEHYQGDVDDITEHVKTGLAELGIVYVSERQMKIFLHILSHKQLNFTSLDKKPMCIYVGPNNPLYHRESITAEELKTLHFIRNVKDFFALEHHLQRVNIAFNEVDLLKNAIYTNSESTMCKLLLETDLCRLGISSNIKKYEDFKIKALQVEDLDLSLNIGYVYSEGQSLSKYAKWFIEQFKETL